MLDKLRAALERRLGQLISETSSHDASQSRAEDVDALRAKGNEFIATGDYVEAENWFRKALQARADDTPTLVCLGFALKEQGRLSEARVALRRAITTSQNAPDEFEMHYLLGQISEQQGDLADAEKFFAESLRLKPDFFRACKDLCRILASQRNYQAIVEVLERCVTLYPQSVEYRLLFAEACEKKFDFEGIATHLKVAVSLGVRTVDTYMTLGAALCRTGRVAEATQVMALAQAMDPGVASQVQYQIAYFHLRNGELRPGLEHMEQAIALEADLLAGHSAILMALSHADIDDRNGAYRQAAERYAKAVMNSMKNPVQHHPQGRADPTEPVGVKLRVGFVSGDFHRHPVAFFLKDVLKHLDQTRLHLIAYSNNPFDDEITDSLKTQFNEWHSIRSLTDDQAAELISSHRLDVLLDLGGHTGENRLPVFARRPAPTQATWLGYFASTGLTSIDYIIGDAVSTPIDTTEWFSEKVYRMPHTRLCLGVPETAHEISVRPPPCLRNGYVTFGSYQQAMKINHKVLSAWSKIMQIVPKSRLRIQTEAIDTPSMRERLVEDMRKAGIDLSRVTMLGAYELEQYLESHNEVDVLLDTFPYPGGTTTAFALWMGVPTITLTGDTMLARQGASMLKCVGLTDWIAQNESEYVDIGVRAASDPSLLATLRMGLREKALQSPLFDGAIFARDFQAALFQMSHRADPGPAKSLI
jgi:predicted O-linked N-acetylglucosamine transferase (SPINDLY family)